MSDKFLNIYIQNSNPVELNILSESLNGLSYLYASFVEKNNLSKDFEPKLYVKEIRDGSIDLYLCAGMVYTLLSNASDPTFDFAKQLIELIKYFLGEVSEKPDKYTVKEIKSLIEAVDIIARDPKSNQTIQIKDTHGNVYQNCTFNFDSVKANAIQNNGKRYIEEELKKEIPELIIDTPMYWAHANFVSNKQHGKVIIEAISNTAKNVVFLNETEHLKCNKTHDKYPDIEWQNLLYRVDVKAIFVNSILKGYEIVKVYDDVMPLDEN